MKILFNTYYHAFQNPGGGEVVLLKTKEALLKLGVQVDLFDPWKHKLKNYDLIHNFATLNYRDWDGFKAYCPKLVVTPVMWPDDSIATCLKEKLKAQIKDMCGMSSSEVNFWNALQRVDHFFPTTNQESERIQKRFGISEKKFTTIYNGVGSPDESRSENYFYEKYKLKDYYLFVGRISPLKNVHLIIESVIKTGQKIVIIGQSDIVDKKYHEDLIEKYKKNELVYFLGPLVQDSKELNDAYYASKAVVVASHFETCSLVGLEAGIRGVPVIMTNQGATHEVYGNFVEYINPNEPDNITKSLEINWSLEKKEALKQHIKNNYQWENIAKRLVSQYEEIIKN